MCLVRLFLMPALLLTAAFLIGIRGVGFAGLISVFASATAIASFTMTQQMGGDAERSWLGTSWCPPARCAS